jgi:hypothetical protein
MQLTFIMTCSLIVSVKTAEGFVLMHCNFNYIYRLVTAVAQLDDHWSFQIILCQLILALVERDSTCLKACTDTGQNNTTRNKAGKRLLTVWNTNPGLRCSIRIIRSPDRMAGRGLAGISILQTENTHFFLHGLLRYNGGSSLPPFS